MKKTFYILFAAMFFLVSNSRVSAQSLDPWIRLDSLSLAKEKISTLAMTVDTLNLYPIILFGDANGKATVLKYNAGNWKQVGKRSFSSGKISQPALSVDRRGVIYAAYTNTLAGKDPFTEVQYFDNVDGTWKKLDSIPYTMNATSIVFDSNYNAFLGGLENYSNFRVLQLSSGNWNEVVAAKIANTGTLEGKLQIDSKGNFYIGRTVYNSSEESWFYLQRFKNGHWLILDSILHSSGGNSLSLEVRNDVPFLAYSEFNSHNIYLLNYNGTRLQSIAPTPSLQATEGGQLFLQVSGSGIPYILYVDQYYSRKISLIDFDNGQWNLIAEQTQDKNPKFYFSFQIDNANGIYASYMNDTLPLVQKISPLVTASTQAQHVPCSYISFTAQTNGHLDFSQETTLVILTDMSGRKEIHQGNIVATSVRGMVFAEVFEGTKVCRTKLIID